MEVFEKLYSFRDLKEGWDSYGASVISDTSITNAESYLRSLPEALLNEAETFPGPDGSVDVEYKLNTIGLTDVHVVIWFEVDGTTDFVLDYKGAYISSED